MYRFSPRRRVWMKPQIVLLLPVLYEVLYYLTRDLCWIGNLIKTALCWITRICKHNCNYCFIIRSTLKGFMVKDNGLHVKKFQKKFSSLPLSLYLGLGRLGKPVWNAPTQTISLVSDNVSIHTNMIHNCRTPTYMVVYGSYSCPSTAILS